VLEVNDLRNFLGRMIEMDNGTRRMNVTEVKV